MVRFYQLTLSHLLGARGRYSPSCHLYPYQLAEVRKKYKDDRQKQQAATMELYRQQGVNPRGGLSGCLPSVVQMPILIALYYVFSGNARLGFPSSAHFLFVPNLNSSPFSNP